LSSKAGAQARPEPARHGLPLHYQLYLRLREQIELGEFAADSLLPGEEELARRFTVSRVTVRRTLATLEDEGFIRRVQGRGTFVRERPMQETARASLSDVLRDMRVIAGATTVKMVEFDYRVAPPAVCKSFGLAEGTVMQWAVRLRAAGPRQFMHLSSWIPVAIGSKWTARDMERHSMQDLLRRAGAHVVEGDQIVTARLADPAMAELLDVKPGSPLLRLQRQYRDKAHAPVAQLDALAPAASFELRISLQPDNLWPPAPE